MDGLFGEDFEAAELVRERLEAELGLSEGGDTRSPTQEPKRKKTEEEDEAKEAEASRKLN